MNEIKELSEYETLLREESELIALREKLEAEIAPLDQKLSLAKAEAFRGKFMEPVAFREMEGKVLAAAQAIRATNVKIMQVQRRMGIARHHHAQKNVESEKHLIAKKREMFVRAAQDILPEATFIRIWQVVEGRMKDLPQ